MQRLKNFLSAAGGLAVFVVIILLYNLQYEAVIGDPRIPTLRDKWWAGYFLGASGDSIWCLVRCSEPNRQATRMVVLRGLGGPVTFQVQRNSSDETFVRLSMSSPGTGLRVTAKQLYQGKRYFSGRLMAGRWRDFWQRNDDIAIRGQMASGKVTVPFEIEPISERRVGGFYSTYVAPGNVASLESLSDEADIAFARSLP